MKSTWSNSCFFTLIDLEADRGVSMARPLFSTLSRHGVAVDRVGNDEPLKGVPDDIQEFWANPILLKRRSKPKAGGGIYFKSAFSPFSVFYWDVREKTEASNGGLLSIDLAATLQADLAISHRLRPTDLERLPPRLISNSRTDNAGTYSLLIGGPALQDGVPDLFWQTIFGPEYLSQIGEKAAQSVTKKFPEYATRLSNGQLCIQLAETLEEFADASESELSRLRKAIKLELAADIFYVRADDEKG